MHRYTAAAAAWQQDQSSTRRLLAILLLMLVLVLQVTWSVAAARASTILRSLAPHLGHHENAVCAAQPEAMEAEDDSGVVQVPHVDCVSCHKRVRNLAGRRRAGPDRAPAWSSRLIGAASPTANPSDSSVHYTHISPDIRPLAACVGMALIDEDLTQLPFAVALARRTDRVIRQTLRVSLGVAALLIPSTLFGLPIGSASGFHKGPLCWSW